MTELKEEERGKESLGSTRVKKGKGQTGVRGNVVREEKSIPEELRGRVHGIYTIEKTPTKRRRRKKELPGKADHPNG